MTAALSRDALAVRFLPREGAPPVEWVVSEGLTPYEAADAGRGGHRARRRA